jgi:hypothetical protein
VLYSYDCAVASECISNRFRLCVFPVKIGYEKLTFRVATLQDTTSAQPPPIVCESVNTVFKLLYERLATEVFLSRGAIYWQPGFTQQPIVTRTSTPDRGSIIVTSSLSIYLCSKRCV